ncbi:MULTISPECIES: META domain-containing protein [unclassified Streptomyces]|uniref:META domain-containing protein n=2 Tax=Streptomyces TaxID=1883 RepID=UPI002DDB3F10|nr:MULTISPECIES: META domain-containing protein [unclassified Streptomyces]WSF85810.1 META domain-containing protein [Streptomyces sp. NBC_01744]WSC37904.1 META domain-containing protein [Streptomyces sp. NBC_01763]WSC54974.1 META domain-containing protein [Streptomyces sp. NBC_01761]WSD25683.1 META domain-containing protein [Streptomyces sp. NBC_01751]WSJ52357.1 META domain-containing protein [Streptomyces sp. NBC_01318]
MFGQRMAVSVLALLTLAACGTESGSGSGDGSGSVRTGLPVTGVHWNVDSVTAGGKRTAAPDGAHVTITPDGRATGNFGCNHFTAAVRVDGDTVTVKPATTTEMGCDKDLQQFERALSSTFSGRLTAAATEKHLTLTTAKGDSIAFTSEPSAPLIGTTWTVTGLVSGSAASSLPAGAEKKARLSFGKDDSVQGIPGCNQIRGAAKVSGSAITFGRINGTKMMCPDPQMKVERALLAILAGKTTYRIDHRTLTLTAANGEGFSATAPAPGK